MGSLVKLINVGSVVQGMIKGGGEMGVVQGLWDWERGSAMRNWSGFREGEKGEVEGRKDKGGGYGRWEWCRGRGYGSGSGMRDWSEVNGSNRERKSEGMRSKGGEGN